MFKIILNTARIFNILEDNKTIRYKMNSNGKNKNNNYPNNNYNKRTSKLLVLVT